SARAPRIRAVTAKAKEAVLRLARGGVGGAEGVDEKGGGVELALTLDGPKRRTTHLDVAVLESQSRKASLGTQRRLGRDRCQLHGLHGGVALLLEDVVLNPFEIGARETLLAAAFPTGLDDQVVVCGVETGDAVDPTIPRNERNYFHFNS